MSEVQVWSRKLAMHAGMHLWVSLWALTVLSGVHIMAYGPPDQPPDTCLSLKHINFFSSPNQLGSLNTKQVWFGCVWRLRSWKLVIPTPEGFKNAQLFAPPCHSCSGGSTSRGGFYQEKDTEAENIEQLGDRPLTVGSGGLINLWGGGESLNLS